MPSVGIDIQYLSEFPNYYSKIDSEFFQNNFTDSEILYAKKKENIHLTLMGIFSIKESIFKCDNSYVKNFNKIEIKHDENGKPFYNSFQISISHSIDVCVSVAIKLV